MHLPLSPDLGLSCRASERLLTTFSTNLFQPLIPMTLMATKSDVASYLLCVENDSGYCVDMVIGTRKQRQRQEELWYRRDLAEAAGHPFYRWLNEVLDEAGFDESCEARCRKFYHEKLGPRWPRRCIGRAIWRCCSGR